ncbi:MAG: DUF2065 domain-containing protein [Shewanella sp.]|nr:DUF2065 domain-containing protein [Shewanella sp.]MCF1429391.1 DUF2065 domain-containing protein [Shewanella sp.]MCF1437932.1 DUF2065 domain-containing protein [Shewanella sp.]MCF1456037.1 DUF2065 domain-containing protein [Shewanella sp.]
MSFEVWMLALGLVMLIEGLGPAFFPAKWQTYLIELAKLDQNLIRRIGGSLVTAGVILMIIFS